MTPLQTLEWLKEMIEIVTELKRAVIDLLDAETDEERLAARVQANRVLARLRGEL
jgi:hypothetical protein